jgi:hypothetical protein
MRIGLLLLFVLCALPGLARAQTIDEGLVAYYPFDGSLADATGQGGDGSVLAPAQAPAWVAGVDGLAAQFDGVDDAVRFLGLSPTAFNGNFTISFFMKVPQVNQPVDILGRRVGCATAPPPYLQWITSPTVPTRPRFELVSGTGTTPLGGGSGRNLVAGTWRHVAVTRGTSSGSVQFRVYDDGEQSGSVSNGPTVDLSGLSEPFGISISPCIAAGRRPFDGAIDELRIYGRALSAAEIATLAAGDGIGRLGPVTVTPPAAGAGASVVMTVTRPGLPAGSSCEARLDGATGTPLGALSEGGDGNWRGTLALPAALAAGPRDLHAVCVCPSCPPTSVGRDRISILPPPVLTPSRASGHAGLAVDFEASGVLGDRLTLDLGGRVVYGPVAISGGSHAGRFVVPLPAGALPAAGQLTLRGFLGRVPVSTVAVPFTEVADPGWRVRITDTPPSGPIAPQTAVRLSGRLEAVDGEPGRRTINVFFRSDAGRVIPLGQRDVVPDAQGDFAIDVELPSAATQDGFIARGPGSLFYTVVEIDPLTGGVRTTRTGGGPIEATGYTGIGAGARAEITVRDPQGNPLAGAYVIVGIGASRLRDPDGANTAYALAGPLNQLSAESTGVTLDLSSCPVNLAQGYTDANGRFIFEVDPNAARRPGQVQAATCAINNDDTCIANDLVWTDISIRASQLGFGQVRNGVVVPTVIPAAFALPPAGALGGHFVAPDGAPYNSATEAWRPVVTLPPLTPALSVVPYIQRGEMQPAGTGPGGPEYIELPDAIGGQTWWYDLGRWFDVGSAAAQQGACDGDVLDPRPVDPARICVLGNPLGEQRVHYFHDSNIAGVPRAGYPRLVICADGTATCASGTAVPMDLDAAAGIGAACGASLSRYSVRFPNAPVGAASGTVGGRIEVRSDYQPPGGGAPILLAGQAPLRKRLAPLPDWFLAPPAQPGGAPRFAGRTVRQSPNGALFLYADESLSGGGRRGIDANSSQFSEVNLPAEQRNGTTSGRRMTAVGGPGAALVGQDSAIASDNEVANNPGAPLRPGANALGGVEVSDRRVAEIIDTGKIPLFRVSYGLAPIAAATLGADFWLQAGVRYGGSVQLGADVPHIVYITEPFSEFGIDLFFDLSAIVGLVSASVEASASVYVANPIIYDSQAPDISSNQCFGFELDATFEICVLFCASYPVNLVSVYEARPSSYRNCCITSAAGMPGFPDTNEAPFESCPAATAASPLQPPARGVQATRPTLRAAPDASLSYAPDGRGAMTYAGRDGRVVTQVVPSGPVGFEEDTLDIAPAVNVTATATAALTLGRGVVLWAYVPPPADSLEGRTQAAHIRWAALRPGQGELTPRDLTPPGSGDGNVVAAACPEGVGNCPAGGEVTAVWMRRIGARWEDHHYALMQARYRPATGWSVPARVDSAQGSASDLQPTVAYHATSGTAIVAWSRKAAPGLAAQETRRIAYRFLDGSSPVRIAGELPAAAAWPSLARRVVVNGQLASEEMVLAYTVNVVDPALPAGQPRAFLGNTNALHVARAQVQAQGTLAFTDERLRDRFGRDLRAEKPTVAADGGGAIAVGFNGLGFGPDAAGSSQRSNDPIGMLSGQGDFVMVRPRLDGTPVTLIDFEADSIGAFKPAFAFNPALDAFESVSQPLAVGSLRVAKAARRYGITLAAKGKAESLGPSARRAGVAAGPDFRIDAVATTARRITPGQTIAVEVAVRNIGRAYATTNGPVALVATWNAPDGAAAVAAIAPLPALDTEAVSTTTLQVPVPADIDADAEQVLLLSVRTAPAVGEADAADNVALRRFNSLARPVDLVATGEPGQPMLFLRWSLDDPDDDRIAGWRVMRVEDDGRRVPLGSTPVSGFVDLAAGFGVARRYAVVSYSANGVESPESEVVAAMAVAATDAGPDALFGDGFEQAQ